MQTTNEVRNSTRIVYFQGDCFPLISTTQFKARRLKDFAHNWKKMTSDAFLLDTVQHCHIEFKQGSSCDQQNVQRFNSIEENIIDAEILRLCEKGVLEETTHCKGEFKYPIFTRRKDAQMELSASAKSDLKWWIDNIQQSEKKISPLNPDIVLTTDASKQGWRAVRDHHTTGGRWSPTEAEKLELKAVFFALSSLCKNVRNKHIRILSDNTTTVCYINNMGGSKSRACNTIAKKIWQFALEEIIF